MPGTAEAAKWFFGLHCTCLKTATVACNSAGASKGIVKRLQLINMHSRETTRLPADSIRMMLGSDEDLPVQIQKPIPQIPPSDKYFVYIVDPLVDRHVLATSSFHDSFLLVQRSGDGERIIESGRAHPIRQHAGEEYVDFRVKGDRIGEFSFYCSSTEALSADISQLPFSNSGSASDRKLMCTGWDLAGCPQGRPAIYETKSDRTWKTGIHWVFVCEQCSRALIPAGHV